jgi:translation initiation factor IF-2
MSDQKPTRLGKAASYFNVGREEIVELLVSKGFEIDGSPNAKIDDSMFEALNEKYSGEHQLKEQSNMMNPSFQKTKEEEQKQKAKQDIEEQELAKAEAKQKEEEQTKLEAEKKMAQEAKKLEEAAKKAKEDSENIESKVVLAGPKIIGQVELEKTKSKETKKTDSKTDDIDQSNLKPEDHGNHEVAQQDSDKKQVGDEKEPKHIDLPKEEATSEHIKTNYQKLEGAKVIGNINLDEFKKDPKPKVKVENEVDKKRARIKPANKIDTQDKTHVKFDNKDKNKFVPKKDFVKKDKDKDPEVRVVSEKEIEENIRRTEARMNGGVNKNQRQKIRKKKREEQSEKARLNEVVEDEKHLKITEFITVSELASLMNMPPTSIISFLFGMGVVVSINQRLDAEIIELITSEYDYEVSFLSVEDSTSFEEEEDSEDDLESRAPIVTIMGHVDHGKTSLLDYIRNASVAKKEAGGITQHIGAYDVLVPKFNRKITFIDTPGHEAFTAMRARGAKLTDIAVIVIAADDKVMPQTREAISHAQSASVPMVFAMNKMDKPGANPDGVRTQLSEMNLLVESWGGKYQEQEISAKSGQGVEDLLEKIILEADMLELKANPKKLANGTVIEASLDKGRGYVATVLVLGGTLEVGDFIVAGSNYGKVKAMFDYKGNKLEKVYPGEPVQILGLNGAPAAGENFKQFTDEQEAKQVANKRSQIEREQGIRTKKHITLDEIGRRLALGTFKELNIIIKGDVDGSVQALSDSLTKLSTEEIQVNILHKAVGAITESDVLLASASDAIIIGFQVRPSAQAKLLAEKETIDIRHYSVIYQAIDEIKAAMEGMLEPTFEERITGNIEIKELFKIPKIGTIAGCYVIEGKVNRASKVRIIRDGIVKFTGELSSLKRFKDDVKEVVHGQDCGLSIKNNQDIEVGDIIEAFDEIQIKRTL